MELHFILYSGLIVSDIVKWQRQEQLSISDEH